MVTMLIDTCGGLNRHGLHRLTCLNALFIGSDTIRGCGLVEAGKTLLEEVCLILFLLPTDLNVELSATSPALCLTVYNHTSCHDNNVLNI